MHLGELRERPLDDRLRYAPYRLGAVEEQPLALAGAEQLAPAAAIMAVFLR
jgi:hypothetical protein